MGGRKRKPTSTNLLFLFFFFSDFATGDFKKIWFMKMVQCVKNLLCFRTCFISVFFFSLKYKLYFFLFFFEKANYTFKLIEIHFNLLYFTFIYIYIFFIIIIIIIKLKPLKFSQFSTLTQYLNKIITLFKQNYLTFIYPICCLKRVGNQKLFTYIA